MKLLSPSSSDIQKTLDQLQVSFRKRKPFFLALFAWVLMGLTTVVGIVPQVQQSFTDRETIETQSAEFEKIKASVAALSRLDKVEIEATLPLTETALPFEKPVLPLLYSIDRLAREAQVSVSNFAVSPGSLSSESATLTTLVRPESPLAAGVLALPLQMDVAGSFENMNAFFKLLDDIVPLMHVSAIEFSAQESEVSASQSAQFQATVNLNTLYSDHLTPPTTTVDASTLALTPSQQVLLEKLRAAYQTRASDELIGGRVVPSTSSGTRNLFQTQ